MSGDIRHEVRQVYYRWCKWRDDPLYTLFLKMYAVHNSFSTAYIHPNNRYVILADFVCPLFDRYRGREIACFNGKTVSVYWLPGAFHSGGGYVEPGTYHIKVNRFTLKAPLYLTIVKDHHQTAIEKIALLPSPNITYYSSDGGFVPYEAIKKELVALVIKWLNSFFNDTADLVSDVLNNPDKKMELFKIISACRDLASDAIRSKADELLPKLNFNLIQ